MLGIRPPKGVVDEVGGAPAAGCPRLRAPFMRHSKMLSSADDAAAGGAADNASGPAGGCCCCCRGGRGGVAGCRVGEAEAGAAGGGGA
eukprot:726450-Prorocentrum_minimum.AAC.1